MKQLQNNQNWIEMTILCNMMVNAAALKSATQQLQEADFSDSRNRVIFRALSSLDMTAPEQVFTMLLHRLQTVNLVDDAGGKSYVTCVYLFSPAGNIDDYVDLLSPRRYAA